MYQVQFSESASNNLKKLDKQITQMLFAWITKNLINTDNPRLHGKGLSADKAGMWRYRVGDYRILAHIEDSKLIILVVNAGHRRDI